MVNAILYGYESGMIVFHPFLFIARPPEIAGSLGPAEIAFDQNPPLMDSDQETQRAL